MDTNILIAGDDPLLGRMLQQALQKAGYRVDAVSDGIAARDRLLTKKYDALITDWMMRGLDGIELIRLKRASGCTGYAALVTELNIPAARSHAIREGADDFFSKPVVAAEIVRSVARFLERRASGTIAAPQTPPPDANAPLGLLEPLSKSSAWGSLGLTIQGVLSDTIQVPITLGPTPTARGADDMASVLVMVDAEHVLELHVTVETSMGSAVEIARAMLGEGDPADEQTLRDLVSEVANIVAGSLKVSFARDAFGFTLGIAKQRLNGVATDLGLLAAHSFVASGMQVVVRCGVGARNAIVVQPGALREGMVLAESLFSSSGGLLLPLGTRLTATATERLRGALKGRTIKVCIPEAA